MKNDQLSVLVQPPVVTLSERIDVHGESSQIVADQRDDLKPSAMDSHPPQKSPTRLRPYQTDAIEAIRAHLAVHQMGYVVLPTGTGKTVIFLDILQRALSEGKSCLIVVPSEVLLEQTRERLVTMHIPTDISYFYGKKKNLGSLVTITIYRSLLTLLPKIKTKRKNLFDMVIFDEAHHAIGPNTQIFVQKILTLGIKMLGLTATPTCDALNRKSGEAFCLSQILHHKVFELPLAHAFDGGYLSPIIAFNISFPYELMEQIKSFLRPKFKSSKKSGSVMDTDEEVDFKNEKIAELLQATQMDQVIWDLFNHCALTLFDDQPLKSQNGLIFVPTKACGYWLADSLNKHCPGVAVFISGDDSKVARQHIFSQFGLNIKVIITVQVLTEGWDMPNLAWMMDLRPTKSPVRYLQMNGRLTRLHDTLPAKALFQLVLDEQQKLFSDVFGSNVVGKQTIVDDLNHGYQFLNEGDHVPQRYFLTSPLGKKGVRGKTTALATSLTTTKPQHKRLRMHHPSESIALTGIPRRDDWQPTYLHESSPLSSAATPYPFALGSASLATRAAPYAAADPCAAPPDSAITLPPFASRSTPLAAAYDPIVVAHDPFDTTAPSFAPYGPQFDQSSLFTDTLPPPAAAYPLYLAPDPSDSTMTTTTIATPPDQRSAQDIPSIDHQFAETPSDNFFW